MAPATPGSSERRRGPVGRSPAQGEHEADGDGRKRNRRALELVYHIGDRLVVGEGEQQVARLLVGTASTGTGGATSGIGEHRDQQPVPRIVSSRPPVGKVNSRATKHRKTQTSSDEVTHRQLRGTRRAGRAARIRRSPTPAAAMSWPLRLSGRRRQAMSPQAANDPPMRR